MNSSKNYQLIADFYHKKPHQYKSITNTLKHTFEHNTRNNTHTLKQWQIQVAA